MCFLFDGPKPSQYVHRSYDLLQLINVTDSGAGIFPKFWSISSPVSPWAPTITDTVSVLIPHILVVSILRSLYFESFSMTFVEVFWSDGTDTSKSLQHRLAWSGLDNYIRLVRWQLPIPIYLHIPENCNRLGFVFIPPRWDFNTVTLARLLMDVCSCLIVPL